MKKVVVVVSIIVSVLLMCEKQEYKPLNGDIIFQTSLSNQSKAVQLATNSPYSHMGIVYVVNGKVYVYEASRMVKLTPLRDWVNRGKNGKYIVKRLKNRNEILTEATIAKMLSYGKTFEGKPYDLYFEWSDDRIYCSELVWKIYEHATGLKIGELKKLKDFDLSRPEVDAKIKERYGKSIPENEIVISPESMFNSPLLETVFRN
jgi:uncharacterized protein YycO